MNVFTDHEKRLIGKLQGAAPGITLELREACPIHSVCTPLPLFRLYRVSDDEFEAEWNTYHRKGPRQVFQFADVESVSESK